MFQYDFDLNSADFGKFVRWIELWKKVLSNWKNSYFQIKELNHYFANNQNVKVSFSKNQFFGSGKYAWPYSFSNAKLILKKAKYHKNLYELLFYHPFDGDLSLHKTYESLSETNSDYDESPFLDSKIRHSIFAKSKKNREEYFNSLKIVNWTYSQVIISAICYCLQDIFIHNTEKLPQTVFWKSAEFPERMQKESLLFNLKCFFYSIFDYLVYFEPNELLVDIFTEINLISVYKFQFLGAFQQKFKEVHKNALATRHLNEKKINKTALFHIFKACNLGIIFPDYLITNVVTWSENRNYFLLIIDMIDINKSFLEKLDLFSSTYVDSENFEKNNDEIQKMFIIDFFQLETIDGRGIFEEYGNLENQDFIELVKFFHTLFPSFSLEKIYEITENQYLFLKRLNKNVETEIKIFRRFQNLPFLEFLYSFTIGCITFIGNANAAAFTKDNLGRRDIVPGKTFVVSSFPAPSRTITTWRGSTPLPQAQAQPISQPQVTQEKTPSGQYHLSISSTRSKNFAQNPYSAQNTTPGFEKTSFFLRLVPAGRWSTEALPKTQSEIYVSHGQDGESIIVHGAGGNYNELKKDMAYLRKYAEEIGAKIVVVDGNPVAAHLAPMNMRASCNLFKEVGTSIMASRSWNQAEERIDPECRRIPYVGGMNTSLVDIFADQHQRVRVELEKKFEEQAKSMSRTELLLYQQTLLGHEEQSYVSARQLCRDSESLGVKPEQGIFVVYARATMLQMKGLYNSLKSPVQEAMFHNNKLVSGKNAQKQVKPGAVLDLSREMLDSKYLVGMGICENLSSSEARKILQTQLANTHYEGYTYILQASERYADLEKKQNQGQVTNLPSFNSTKKAACSPKPGTPEYRTYLEQNRVEGLNQLALDPQQALEMTEPQGIDDFNTRDKHPLRMVAGRLDDEVFKNEFKEN